ncbi:MAG TPA: signal peptide peptidase SppA [Opitutaceae bacterium]
MKNFFTSLLGSLVALLIFAGGAVLLLIVFLGVVAALGEKTVSVEKGAYLVFDLGVNITDAPQQFDGAALVEAFTGGESKSLQLREVTNALRAAARDERIAGVFLHGEFEPVGYGTGFSALREVREALGEVKAAGKPVQAFLEFAGTRELYLASAAGDVAVDPYGLLMVSGLASQPMFFAGAFERFGIGVQVTRVGKYKSAIEPFVRKDLSPENREQLQLLLDDVWREIRNGIAADRGITPEQFQALIESGEGMRPEAALKAGVISRVLYRDEILGELKKKTGRTGPKDAFKQIGLADYIKVAPEVTGVKPEKDGGEGKRGKRGRIAVVYAEGNIVDGEGEIGEVSGEKFSRELRRLRQDDDIKAIVLRVNSPGGSASASERIQREIRLAREKKPVVVSMGSYAASGGYWISTYGERIFAEPTTITGSIGVFGVFFNAQKLANDLGFTFDVVKTGKFADSLTIARPQTADELARWQHMVDWIYDEFLMKVAESRQLDRDKVHEIAQGRVWSGAEALKLGLVDEIGGLEAALAYAAQKAGLGADYAVTEYPRKKELAEAIAEMFEGFKPATSRAGVATRLVEQMREEVKILEQFNDRRGVYARLPVEIYVR